MIMMHFLVTVNADLRHLFPRALAGLLLCLALVLPAHGQVEVLSQQQISLLKIQASEVNQQQLPVLLRKLYHDLQKKEAHAKDTHNVGRVLGDLQQTASSLSPHLIHYAVPPLSSLMRLPDAYPTDGKPNAALHILASQDEYEPASFLLYSYMDLQHVQLQVSDLAGPNGTTIAANQLDLKVVKVWYQNRNGWFSYFSDVGLELVPELLLKDENLVHVDTQQVSNHARVRSSDGQERHVWISAPRELDVPFDHYQQGFEDAAALAPVSLDAGRFKQFFLTAHVTADTKPGVYEGRITVHVKGQPAHTIPVRLRVLPWRLPLPMAWFDPEQSVTVALMGAWPRLALDHPAYMPTLLNLRQHNLYHTGPGFNPRSPEFAREHVAGMKAAGFETKPIMIRHSIPWMGTHDATPYTFDQLVAYRRVARAWRSFFEKEFGHHDAHIGIGDEPTAMWIMKTRRVWRVIQGQGLKVMLAGHSQLFDKAGYIIDMDNAAGTPDQLNHALQRHIVGHGRISFYANQHNGAENPDFVRRQHGLLGYFNGLSAVYNYEFAYGPWNDRSQDLYKPMVLAYPTHTGLVDTLAWEGFREAIDDMRYATLLRQRAVHATQSNNLDVVYAGRKVLQWFAMLDLTTVDLAGVRLEMIGKLFELEQLDTTQTSPES